MQKIHFATRVTAKLVPKSDASNASNNLRQELSTIINKNRVSIDRSVFAKTEQEKLELKIAKMKYKAGLAK
jgi:hypothetical protein